MTANEDREIQVCEAISRFSAEHGYQPTVRELAAMVSLPSSTVWQALVRLRRAAKVDWVEGQPRTLHVCQLLDEDR